MGKKPVFSIILGGLETLRNDKKHRLWNQWLSGILQILWERGLIDESKLIEYTMDGKADPRTEKVDLNFSLKHLMATCYDFQNEKSSLTILGEDLQVKVRHTPKFHAELAGEGIEYCWGFCKGIYRRLPTASKKGRASFQKLVRECTSPRIVTKERVRKFSARARAYICTYAYFADKMDEALKGGKKKEEIQMLLLPQIERLKKKFKTHRCAYDFERGFITAEIESSLGND